MYIDKYMEDKKILEAGDDKKTKKH